MKRPLYIDTDGAVRWDRRSPDRPTSGSDLDRVYRTWRLLDAIAQTVPADSPAEALYISTAARVLLGVAA